LKKKPPLQQSWANPFGQNLGRYHLLSPRLNEVKSFLQVWDCQVHPGHLTPAQQEKNIFLNCHYGWTENIDEMAQAVKPSLSQYQSINYQTPQGECAILNKITIKLK
jgi:hypothetical protein